MPTYYSQTTDPANDTPTILDAPDHAAATPAAQRMPGVQNLFEQANLTGPLADLEALLIERTESHSLPIAAAGAHTVRSGGKRLRAAMVLLAARLGREDLAATRHAAAAVELIHAASLVHDDLVDGTDRRRGHVTVHTQWDSDVALMVGDYFFALAAAEMARCPDPRIITFYAQAVQTIVEGELHPVTQVTPLDTAMRQYLYKTGSKTAALFEAGCKAGMATGSGSDDDIAALGRYGYDLGIAFQIVDDLLDFVGSEHQLGKPAGNDLRQGTITLPLIYAVDKSNSAFLRDIAGSTDLTDEQVQQAIQEAHTHGGIQRTRDTARQYIQQAIGNLDRFPPSVARQTLQDIAEFVLERQA